MMSPVTAMAANHQWLHSILVLSIYSMALAEDEMTNNCGNDVTNHVFELQERVTCLEMTMDGFQQDQERIIQDCGEAPENDIGGIYQIQPPGVSQPFNVTCLFDGDGKWTVLQHRVSGSTDFYRSWAEYKRGFGANGLDTNLWLGLEYMHLITSQRQYTLRIDLKDWNDASYYAEYRFFIIHDEANGYKLELSGFSGTLSDQLLGGNYPSNGMKFSTFDRDNDILGGNCAVTYQSGWWHRNCYHVNLNGPYRMPPNQQLADALGIQWIGTIGSGWYSMKESMMRIKQTFDD